VDQDFLWISGDLINLKMANPPNYLVTRTLVKRYFKRFLPTVGDSTKPYFDEIIDCWKVNGMFSEKCQPIVDKLDAA